MCSRFFHYDSDMLQTILQFCILKSFCALILQEVEKDVKAKTKGEMGAAKTLCSPFDQPELPEGSISVSCQHYELIILLLSPKIDLIKFHIFI